MKSNLHHLLLRVEMIALGWVFTSTATMGEEITIVWPSEYENVEAPDGSGRRSLANGGRNQWLIPNEAFSSLPETHRHLMGFRWRPDGTRGRASTVTWSNLEMYVSTTSADSLGDSFVENLGEDETLVYNAPITLSTTNAGPEGGPKDFDMTFRFQMPFVYDPTSGDNLVFSTVVEATPWQLLGVDEDLGYGNDSIIQVWAQDPLAEFATGRDSSVVPTQYIFAPVPEPSTLLLGALGLVGLLRFVCRR